MGVSKSSSRSKIRSKASSTKTKSSGILKASAANPVSEALATGNLKKQTKLEKKLVKSLAFSSRITKQGPDNNNNDNKLRQALDPNDPSYKDFSAVSKSAARRRKKKLRDALKPNMGDLLSTLNDINDGAAKTGDQVPANEYIPAKKNVHVPNPHKSKKVQAKIESVERQNFQGVLNNGQFRVSPFSSLKDQIQRNLGSLQ